MDADCAQPLVAFLVDSLDLPDMKIMGARLNPLFQCDACMAEAGICIWKLFEAG